MTFDTRLEKQVWSMYIFPEYSNQTGLYLKNASEDNDLGNENDKAGCPTPSELYKSQSPLSI